MSDLISRRALLQKFNDTGIHIELDLPVEEILGEDVDIDDFTMLVQDAIQAYKNMVIGTIKDMPTAYDLEKVVAEIQKKYCKKCRNILGVPGAEEYCKRQKCDIYAVCDIVKRGGVE